jgi:hypothetical protein
MKVVHAECGQQRDNIHRLHCHSPTSLRTATSAGRRIWNTPTDGDESTWNDKRRRCIAAMKLQRYACGKYSRPASTACSALWCIVLDETTVQHYIETYSGTEQWILTEQLVTPRYISTRTHNNRYRRYPRQSLEAVTFSNREILNYFGLCRHIQTVKKHCCAVFSVQNAVGRKIKQFVQP